MHAEVAEKFLSFENQVFLAGDAAHRFPPAGGFGMNTGIQDAQNLAWKLAAVVNGIAPTTLLSTYETERRPIAIFNTALSVQNFRAAMEVPAALGLDPTVANSACFFSFCLAMYLAVAQMSLSHLYIQVLQHLKLSYEVMISMVYFRITAMLNVELQRLDHVLDACYHGSKVNDVQSTPFIP
ncbi:FAD-dependent monooxygenase apdD-like [Spinacia oleracea]|uniref:FAD-dependent monooxygenase apdD-like n=1 Tax=Spinacia oleracea TaxID=3562 RepID=A0ABM3RJ28_SPIOL|nr:FAD-dependent monooxygenase apdD-like [Spinacia oleracea]